jgi:hypothetical protein
MHWFLAVILLACTSGAFAQERQTDLAPEKVSMFMKAKLKHSQKLLEALALEDFESMAQHSQEMALLSHESQWNVLQTPEYVQHSHDFRHRTAALTAAAKKKNLDGAALAYVEVTLNCVQCHKYVRNVRMGDLPKKAGSKK